MTPRFRRFFKVATPGFLQNPDGDGERVLYSLGMLCDAFAEKALRGLEARFPSRATPSANALTAGDRGILRGRAETEAAFAGRLIPWRNPRGHRVRGNAYEALLQIWHYWGGVYAATVDAHGNRHEIAATDSPDVDTLADPDVLFGWSTAGFTNWDSAIADVHWSRFWIVLQPKAADAVGAQPALGDAALWGGALGTPGYTLGQTNVQVEDVTAMRALFQELKWSPGNTQPEWLVLGLEPLVTPAPMPDSTWLYWSKDDAGTRVASRTPDALTFTFGTTAQQNGAGTMTIDLPNSLFGGELLIMHEARESGAFDTAPTGWVVIKTTDSVADTRILARLATGSEPANFAYAVTGAQRHAVKVTAVSTPGEGWNTDVAANFADMVSSGGFTSPFPDTDNAVQSHRLNFLTLINGYLNRTVSGSQYVELYDDVGEINMSGHSATTKITGSAHTPSAGSPAFSMASVRLVYNLSWRFWSLDPTYNNTYGGDRGRPWAMHATEVDGTGTYTGARADGAAFDPQLLPDGSVTYAGVRTRFAARVLLVDDGSIPR